MSYTKNDWTDILPAAVKAKLDLAETGIKYVNDERDKESAPGRALVEAADVAAQRTALDVDSKAEVTAKANAAQAAAESTAASALAGHNSAYAHGNIPTADEKTRLSDIQAWSGETGTKLHSELEYRKSLLKFGKIGVVLWVRTPWDTTQDLVQFLYESDITQINDPVEFNMIRLIDKTVLDADITITTGSLVKSCGDDVCPIYYNSTFIGANHGAEVVRELTATAHGKTNVDVGSEWVDTASKKWWIVKIVDANKLWVVGENTPTGDVWSYNTTITGALTHTSGATHTDSIIWTASTLTMLRPAIRNITKKYYLDGGAEITLDGLYSGQYIDIVNTYEILDVPSIMAYLIASVGSEEEPDYTDDSVAVGATVRIIYRYQPNGACTVYQQVYTKKAIHIDYVGLVQSMVIEKPSSGSIWLYVPDMTAFTIGANSYDLSAIHDITTAMADTITLIPTRWANALKPPSRMIQMAKTSAGVKYFGFAIGYAPIGWGTAVERKDKISSAGYISSSSKKMYPQFISVSSTDYPAGAISAGTAIEGISFRCPLNYTNDSDATCCTWYEAGDALYVLLDYHTTVDKQVKIPDKYLGKTITVVEKTDSFTLYDGLILPDGIGFAVDTYGYAVLKIE